MTTIIHKFAIQVDPSLGVNALELPPSAQILDCQMQGCHMVMWVLLNTREVPVTRRFRVYGTGFRMPEDPGRYIATVQDGGLVWHVFEESEA